MIEKNFCHDQKEIKQTNIFSTIDIKRTSQCLCNFILEYVLLDVIQEIHIHK